MFYLYVWDSPLTHLFFCAYVSAFQLDTYIFREPAAVSIYGAWYGPCVATACLPLMPFSALSLEWDMRELIQSIYYLFILFVITRWNYRNGTSIAEGYSTLKGGSGLIGRNIQTTLITYNDL